MKSNKYADLVKFGLKPETLMRLSESEISRLHKSLIKEQTSPIITPITASKVTLPQGSTYAVPPDKKAEVSNKGGKTEVIVSGEVEEVKNEDKNNPWAICHAQLGPKKTPKFERCVREVKKSLKEGKNYFDILLERKIVSLLEKHMSPKMTKGDLLNLLEAKKMKTPIGKISSLGLKTEDKDSDTKTKPKTKPGTKTPPKEKPHDPFKPSPHKQPKPKAKSETKEEVMNVFDEPTTRPTTKPKTKLNTKDKTFDPSPIKPEPKPRINNKIETKEQVMDAPAKPKTAPTTKPGTKTPPREKPHDPFKPSPHKQPKPKARKKLPSWLTFNSLGIKFKK